MMSEENERQYGRLDPRKLGRRKAGLVMGMGFAGLLITFAVIALQELR
jgi:hypothetical protein